MVLPLTCFTMLLPRTITDLCSYVEGVADLVGVAVVAMHVCSDGEDLFTDVRAGDDAPAAALAIVEFLVFIFDCFVVFVGWAFDLLDITFAFPVCDSDGICNISPVCDGV